jgi:hypothetical protein
MIQVLESAFHGQNQAAKARNDLRSHQFKMGKDTDIHLIISKFNSLCQKAKIPEDDWKPNLWDAIPAGLDHRLLQDSQDENISYEAFRKSVTTAAFSAQRAYEQRTPRDKDRRDNIISRNQRSPKTSSSNLKTDKPVTSLSADCRLTMEEKKVH